MKSDIGTAVNEATRRVAYRMRLRKLAEQRKCRARRHKRKEACTGGAVQTSNATNAIEIQIHNNINLKVCQGGPADD
jgi:hypothetical protein